jgi:peptidoglycan/LPS O-acetylase OafA/YrhL
MSERTQPNIYSLIAPMKLLLVVAVVVCLLSALASWVIEQPVQTASASAEEPALPSPALDEKRCNALGKCVAPCLLARIERIWYHAAVCALQISPRSF